MTENDFERFETIGGRIDRRQWLSALAALGATSFVPAAAAGGDGEDADELIRETVDDGGATATVSETGDIIAFGVYAGTVRAYLASDGDSDEYEAVEFELPGVPSGFAVSHVIVTEETNEVVAAAMDADIIGGGTLEGTAEASWVYEQPGLWDVSTSADLSTVASVSDPIEATPHLAVVEDGDVAWEEPLENASGRAVAVSDDGEYIVVGTGYPFTEEAEATGQPGIRVYAGDGELLWSHETAEEVLDVGVDVDTGVIVAGVDFGSTLAFDLEGNTLWERDDAPTMTALSNDGTTVIAEPPVTALDSGDGSVQWESDVEEANVLADPLSVSADGTRVAVSTFDFEVFVLETGEVIWEDQNEAGPYYSDLSADGTTLATMEVNNDAQNADLVGYRLNPG